MACFVPSFVNHFWFDDLSWNVDPESCLVNPMPPFPVSNTGLCILVLMVICDSVATDLINRTQCLILGVAPRLLLGIAHSDEVRRFLGEGELNQCLCVFKEVKDFVAGCISVIPII